MNDGDDFCGVAWISEPVDGFRCLVSTRRTLDVNGHCCDYDRCAAIAPGGRSNQRCLLPTGHKDNHHGSACHWWKGDGIVPVCQQPQSDATDVVAAPHKRSRVTTQ